MRHYLYKNNSQVEEGVGNQLFGEFFLLVVKQISIWVKCKFIHTSKVAFVNSFILKHHKTFTNHSVKKLLCIVIQFIVLFSTIKYPRFPSKYLCTYFECEKVPS